MEVSQSLPQVTMLGMADADLRLVPTVNQNFFFKAHYTIDIHWLLIIHFV